MHMQIYSYRSKRSAIHRDLKSGNLLIAYDRLTKIAEFGVENDTRYRTILMDGSISLLETFFI